MVLIIDDEESLQELLHHALERDGYRVVVAGTCADGLAAFRSEAPDAILLDVMLPDGSGHDVCREIRATSTVPIVMLTALDDEVDKVVGLELGADDYVTKPFSIKEVLARAEVLLRRQKRGSASETYTFGDCRLDCDARTFTRGGKEVPLSPKIGRAHV